MAALKDGPKQEQEQELATIARGRNIYRLKGVLRTKPGRADCEPTLSMSCSDKIAAWALLGLQGSLLSILMEPVFIDSLIIGDVDDTMREAVALECERAFRTRLMAQRGLSPLRLTHP